MELIHTILGEGEQLTIQQMACRGVIAFFIAILLIIISGRRLINTLTPLDTIILVLLGALLGRAVSGASPFIPVVATCFFIVVLYRIYTIIIARYKKDK